MSSGVTRLYFDVSDVIILDTETGAEMNTTLDMLRTDQQFQEQICTAVADGMAAGLPIYIVTPSQWEAVKKGQMKQ